jgi:copper homeostasis protein (lipoprotein)
MNKRTKLWVSGAVVVGLVVAAIIVISNRRPVYEPDTRAPDFLAHRYQPVLDWAGTYGGTVPCADCEGIETALTLRADNTYMRKTRYIGKSDRIYNENGRFEWQKNNSVAVLKRKGGDTIYKVGEGRLLMLDRDGAVVTGLSADRYVLIKLPDAALTDTYWNLTELMGQPAGKTEREPHIILREVDGRVFGSTGCNTISGQFRITPPSGVRFENLTATNKICTTGMDVEKIMLESFTQVEEFVLNGNLLHLNRKNGAAVAKFEALYMR